MQHTVRVGPGVVRVGGFVGRLGIVSMPALNTGLGLSERVIRRHVAKLQALGWLERTGGIRGDGSLVWLTKTGLGGVGLGQLAAVRAPARFSRPVSHSLQVAEMAAQLERAGLVWQSARQLACDRERWAIPIANERGGASPRLPDLAVWPAGEDEPPVAVVLETSGRHPRRRHALLTGWAQAIASGRYTQVHYPETNPHFPGQLAYSAARLGLTSPQFTAGPLTLDTLTSPPPPPAAALNGPPPPPAALTPPAAVSGAPAPPLAVNLTPAPAEPQTPPEPPPAGQPPRPADEILRQLRDDPDPRPRWRWRRR